MEAEAVVFVVVCTSTSNEKQRFHHLNIPNPV